MAETITPIQEQEQTLLVPKFIKVEKIRKKAFKSDLGLMINFKPENSLKIRVPAQEWDNEERYPAEAGGTPLAYIQSQLQGKIDELNESDDEIKISDFYQIRDPFKKTLTHLECGVTPVERSGVVYEALDFLMNDPEQGMNCEYHPVFRANLHFNRERFQGKDLVPINTGKFYGFITYTGTCQRPIVQYDWKDVPYNVKARYDSKNHCIDIKRMRGGNTGFFVPVEFRDYFTVICFNQRDNGKFEFNVLVGDRNGKVERNYYEANSKEFSDAIEELACCFFDRFKNEKTREGLDALVKSTDQVLNCGGNYCNTDFLYIADGDEGKVTVEPDEKFTIGSAVSSKENDDEEEDVFN